MADKDALKISNRDPIDLKNLPLKFPKIAINYEKCTIPFWCKKCLQLCPQYVFQVYCKKQVKFKESDPREPGNYELLAVRRDKCIMCNKCIDVCPEDAIAITNPEVRDGN